MSNDAATSEGDAARPAEEPGASGQRPADASQSAVPGGEHVSPADPRFVLVSLTELMNEGVLMAANEQFFWPLGLALTWIVDSDLPEAERVATELHVRQWEYTDGHRETIETSQDGVAEKRHHAFTIWLQTRINSLPRIERSRAIQLLSRYQK